VTFSEWFSDQKFWIGIFIVWLIFPKATSFGLFAVLGGILLMIIIAAPFVLLHRELSKRQDREAVRNIERLRKSLGY
jgi:hypothetical protein